MALEGFRLKGPNGRCRHHADTASDAQGKAGGLRGTILGALGLENASSR